jgi:hypothetical protein
MTGSATRAISALLVVEMYIDIASSSRLSSFPKPHARDLF